MARINGSGFKMKQSPAKKGNLSNFFSSLGNQLKAGQKDRGIFSEKGKAEKADRKPGESKFKADIRRRKETKKTTNSEANRINVDNTDDWNDGSLNSSGTKRYNASTSSWEDYTPPAGESDLMSDKQIERANEQFGEGAQVTAEKSNRSQTFKKAFAAARKAGKKTFSWNGKSYTTKLA